MTFVSLLSACLVSILIPCSRTNCEWKRIRWARCIVLAAVLLATLAVQERAAAQIAVNNSGPTQVDTTGNSCSLQEAIYATEFGINVALDQTDPDDTYYTGCSDASGSWDTIDLPGGTLSFTKSWDGDAHNPFGPTATPIIFKAITIRGHATTLQWNGPEQYRLFAIGYASISPTSGVLKTGTYSGTGNLTLQDVYIKGFQAKGGDGGYGAYYYWGGGGGGLGAGGAIYVGEIPGAPGVPVLTVQNSTFDSNGATGGNGTDGINSGGGGGGMGGNGGLVGGGGGSRGNGGQGACNCNTSGGGGGTVLDGSDSGPGGYLCGGSGGSSSNHDGHDATCAGGGGGGTYAGGGNGGNGAFGGGGGAGGPDAIDSGNGGNGGFGGGGGQGYNGGGNGGFGGGGGAGSGGGAGGRGGAFGGNASIDEGGGGGALGGAIFNDGGTVTIQNSTFSNNSVTRGVAGSNPFGSPADNGGDSGGAIFSRSGSLTVQNVTISGNQATGAGGGIVVGEVGETTTFVLDNTIIANNGAQECIVTGTVITTGSKANLIVNNSGCPQVTVTSDPKLDSLKLNTPGDTPTMALLSGSPAKDVADPGTSLATDQRGVQRKATPDIGAYETIPQADLSLSKAVGSSTAKAGDTITYTLTVTNLGPDTANTVTVTDNFPTALTYVSCSAPGGSCGTQGAAVVTTYTSLSANSTQTINITGTLNSGYARGTVITNDASVQASSPADPDSSNNNSSASFTVIVPDFTLSAASPISVDVGASGTSLLTIGSIDTFSSSVSLTGTGPSGFQESFSPNPVTPPSNGSANSTMTVSLGPSVTAGSYTVTENGTSGTLTHSTSVTVNVQATISGTINVIGADQALGCIDNSGISGALESKLQAAQADITAGKIQEAINTLEALLNQLQAQAGKHIKTTCTDSSGNTFNPDAVLIADVKALLASLGVVNADPIIGNVVNGSGTGLSGLTVKILNSKNVTVTTAATDVTGFYYFPSTGGLTPGASYTAKVTVPKGYKNSTPSSQSFTWKAVGIALNNFVLN